MPSISGPGNAGAGTTPATLASADTRTSCFHTDTRSRFYTGLVVSLFPWTITINVMLSTQDTACVLHCTADSTDCTGDNTFTFVLLVQLIISFVAFFFSSCHLDLLQLAVTTVTSNATLLTLSHQSLRPGCLPLSESANLFLFLILWPSGGGKLPVITNWSLVDIELRAGMV